MVQGEVPATVNARGVAGRKTRKLMIELLLMDPWTKSADQAEKLFSEVLRMPFNEGMRRHFKN